MKYFLLVLVVSLTNFSCTPRYPPIGSRPKPSFQSIVGITFIEVKRQFETSLSFNDQGYQLHPSWQWHLLSNDSIKLYNPDIKQYYNFHVHFDHDSVINMARVWLKVKHVSADSLKLQVLRLNGKVINEERSSVFMTLYSQSYISNTLKTSVDSLRKPSLDDTLYIKSKVIEARQNMQKAFAATTPVLLESKSPIIKVKRRLGEADDFNYITESDDYLLPRYQVVINRAYQDFNYSFSVVVDDKANIHFRKSLIYLMPEFEKKKIEIMKGITRVYLKNLLKITPGSTIGIPHASIVELQVKGIKN